MTRSEIRRRLETADKVLAWIGFQVVAMILALLIVGLPVAAIYGVFRLVIWAAWR